MIRILRHRKILIIISTNIVVAFFIAFVSQWLSYKNVMQDMIPTREINKLFILTFFEVFIVILLSLFLFSLLLIKITRPLLEDLMQNEKDLNKAKKQTEKNEKALATLLRSLPVGVVVYNVKENMTYFNEYAINYLGFTTKQHKVKGLVGPALQLIHEDGSEMPLDEYPLNEVIDNQTILKNKLGGIVGKSGNVIWVKYNAFPVFGSLGGLKQVIVTFNDITDQKQMEIALKETNSKLHEQSEKLSQLFDNLKEINTRLTESEARYKLISDFSTSWETYRHPDGTLVYCNPAVENVIGYTREEYLNGIPFPSFVHPDDLDRFMEHYNNGLAGKIVPSCVVRFLHKNQTVRWVDFALRPVLSESGELLGARFSVRDITRLKETEIELNENRELLNLIFQYSNDWEGYRDKTGKLIYCSLAFEQLLGYPVSDYFSDKIGLKEIVHPDDYELTMQHFKRALSGETIPSLIIRYIHRNKNVIWVDVSARPVFSESGEMLGVRYSSKDITELKENEQELKELNATKDKFFSIISHDLKSPFYSLIGLSDMLLKEHEQHSVEEREEIISLINEASKNTFKLLENLLAWARSQSGQLVPNQTKINLKQLLLEITDLLSSTAQNKKISLENTINNDIWVWADSDILNTIFRNLISNSIKYTKEYGKVTLSALVTDGFVEVTVSDTGIGFDDRLLNSLFKIGENHSTPGTNNETGTGLGLVLCKDFVEKSGGKIWAKSEIGKGSTFYFTVPLYH